MEIRLPVVAANHSYKVEVEAGKRYSWCSCGLSKIQPFCDGAHKEFKNPDGSSIMKSVKFDATKNETVYFCGCKKSSKGMFCDETSCKQ